MLQQMIAALLLGAGAPGADGAGNRMEALMAQPAASGDPVPATMCNAGRSWCATIRRDGEDGPWQLVLFAGGLRSPARNVPLPAPAEDESELSVWPSLVREADGTLLVGVVYYRRTMYSGGGAGAGRLRLLRLADAAAPTAVLEAPIEASSSVRACFSRADMRARLQACHDEYEFTGTLTLDPGTRSGRPHFLLTTVARTYPGRLVRTQDSRERGPLRRHDLVWWRDPACSFTRRFAPGAAGQYAPDTPLPACADYLDI